MYTHTSDLNCLETWMVGRPMAGNPCIIQLHAPWVVDNLSSTALEVQLIDQTRSSIVSLEIAAGGSEQLLGVDLRREVFLRLRMPMVKNKASAWSEGFLVHADSGKNEFEGVLPLSDADGHLQPVVVEVSPDAASCGFRVTLYNRYWLLNLTGLALILRKAAMGSSEPVRARTLPVGAAMGYDTAAGGEAELRMLGFHWSAPFSVDRTAGENHSVTLSALEGPHSETCALPNQQVTVAVAASSAAGKFDRTVVITFAPALLMVGTLQKRPTFL